MDDVLIRPAELNDVQDVACVHLKSFDGFYLSKLGSRFLMEFYGALLLDHEGILLVAVVEGGIVGFVAGSVAPRGLYRRLFVRRWLRFISAAIPAAIGSPRLILGLVGGIRRAIGQEYLGSSSELMSLCVLPGFRGANVARELVARFESNSASLGSVSVVLTTDDDNNAGVKMFYEKCGYEASDVILGRGGRALRVFRKSVLKLRSK